MSYIDTDFSADYQIVRRAIELISENWRDQPELDELALAVGKSPSQLQKVFTRWAGLSPKAFLQAVTLDHARRLLRQDVSILDAAYELGLSGPGRLHDLFVTHEAMSPGDFKSRGEGLLIRYGYHDCPFGRALVMATERGLAGLAFCDPGGERAIFADLASRWPAARFEEDGVATAAYATRVFNPGRWRADNPLRVVLIGTDFQIRVWQGLLKIPVGQATTYSHVAEAVGVSRSPRAVGQAIGANPVSFVVPCHRVIGKSGALTGYRWGVTRKRAMLGWEAGVAGQA